MSVPPVTAAPVDPAHPDRVRWNARYASAAAGFAPHPLVAALLAITDGRGPVLELAAGPSGSALALAARGHAVLAVDVADAALESLGAEAARRGLGAAITTLHADLETWRGPAGGFALVLCTRYWERAVFERAWPCVAPGGLLAWEAFTVGELRRRPSFRRAWCLEPGEPATLLPAGFARVIERDIDDERGAVRQLVARRR